jgi:hypothetical protein
MGWDAFSSIKKTFGYPQKGNKFIFVFEDKEQRDAFVKASRRVRKLTGTVDNYLEQGALDCRACAEMLERATGEKCSSVVDVNWSKKKVQSLAKNANWDFKYGKSDAWAYWSAKVFLETCAELRLSISMSC